VLLLVACDAVANYSKYRIDVTKNSDSPSPWCIQELKFYGENANRIATPESGASAETIYNGDYAAKKAFNEVSNYDESYYCSKNGVKTGWLQFDFGIKTKISSYEIESAGGYPAPVDWKFEGSNDGSTWVTLDEQSGHTWNRDETKSFKLIENCFTISHNSGSWDSEVRWYVEENKSCAKSGSGNSYSSKCCISGNRPTVKCSDTYGDGWNGYKLKFNGHQVCSSVSGKNSWNTDRFYIPDTVQLSLETAAAEEAEVGTGNEILVFEDLTIGPKVLLLVGAFAGVGSLLVLCKRKKAPESYSLLETDMSEL